MLIDTHCHLPHKKYEKSLDQVIEDARQAGVTKLVSIGTSLKENEEAIKVADQYPDVFATIAVYPHDDRDKSLEDLQKGLVTQLALSKKIVAIGECGLDITEWTGGRAVEEQIKIFEMQLAVATQNKLPVVIHNRGGDDLIFDILAPFVKQGLVGVAHCFASTQQVAQKYLDIGFYLSFAGMITYKGRDELRDVIAWAPADRILTETDAPYLPPQRFRGQPNEPKNVVDVAQKIAEVRHESLENIANITYSNACTLFSPLKAV